MSASNWEKYPEPAAFCADDDETETEDRGSLCVVEGCWELRDNAYGKYCAGCGPHYEVYERQQRIDAHGD